jgi:hypothetical protein
MSYIGEIRLQVAEDAQENTSWYGESASEPRIYAYTDNDPLNRVDPLGLWTLQVGFSGYVGIPAWGIGGQLNIGIAADTHGNAGFYGTVGGGPTVGGGLRAGIGGAVSSAPTINDLSGSGAGVTVMAGTGVGGSADWSKGGGLWGSGPPYQSWGGSVGWAAGAAASAGPSYTGVICEIGPDCGGSAQSSLTNGSPTLPAPGASNAPTGATVPASLASTTLGNDALGGATGSQSSSLK